MTFQPFVVQCLTCGSHLRVTDPAIVGTIAACPKCNSMVPIEVKGLRVAVGGSPVDSQAITEEAISADEGAALGANVPTSGGFAHQIRDEPPPFEAEPSEPPHPTWQSDRTRRSREIALVIAVSLVSLLVAIAGFTWFVRASRARDVAARSPNPQSTETQSTETQSTETQSTETQTNNEPTTTQPHLVNEPSDDDSESTAKESSAASINDLIPRSPLQPMAGEGQSLPARFPSISAGRPPAAIDDQMASAGMQELPSELAKYTKFLLEEGSLEKPTLQAPPTIDEVTIEAAADEMDDPTLTVRPKEVNLKAALAVRMAVDTKGYPLPDWALLISQITGVPIQIDWVSFDLAGIDLETSLTAPTGWQTAGEILTTIISGQGAEVREEETLVVVTLNDDVFGQQLASLTDVSDFGDHQDSAREVLRGFLRAEGEASKEELDLGVSREDQQIAVIAMEVLRRMRGVKPKVESQRLHRWAWCSNDPSGEWRLVSGGIPGPQLDMPISMADFLRRMARRNQAATLINWYDFNRRSVAPEHLLLPHTKEDAGTTLQGVLEPLGLQARQVDTNHWWLGRESTYDRLPVIVWTPPLGDHRDRFLEELSHIMEGATRDVFRLAMDPHSDRAVILLPRFVVRQLTKLAGGVAATP